MCSKLKDISGMKFGRLTITAHLGLIGNGRGHWWEAKCECGTIVKVEGSSVRTGWTKSCGCLAREKARKAGDRTRTHGLSKTSTYSIWDSMIQRCENPARKDYDRYGGAGITVCERWHKFDNFLADMGQRPQGLTLDRKNGALGYSPENCRWVSQREQNRNQKSNRVITHNGKTMCLAEWAESIGMNTNTFEARLRRGWGMERTITEPIRK